MNRLFDKYERNKCLCNNKIIVSEVLFIEWSALIGMYYLLKGSKRIIVLRFLKFNIKFTTIYNKIVKKLQIEVNKQLSNETTQKS